MGLIAALDGGDVALIVLSAFWGLLVLFLCVVLINTFRVLESTKILIDVMREETVPLLREVKGSLERTNRELDRAIDGGHARGPVHVHRANDVRAAQQSFLVAGDDLDFALAEPTFSVPVGRISYVHLEPLSFLEFATGIGDDAAVSFVRSWNVGDQLPAAVHDKLLALCREYARFVSAAANHLTAARCT